MLDDRVWFEKWLEIEVFERRIPLLQKAGVIPGIVNSSRLDAPVAIGLSKVLEPGDLVFTDHRSLAYAIALGVPMRDLWAELSGRASSLGAGWAGALHLVDRRHGLGGANGIVGAPLGWAGGAALAMRILTPSRLAVAVVGDRATETGAFYENLQLAKRWRLPVVWVIRNNRRSRLDFAPWVKEFGLEMFRESAQSLTGLYDTLSRCVNRARQGVPQMVEVRVGPGDWPRYRSDLETVAENRQWMDALVPEVENRVNRAYEESQRMPWPTLRKSPDASDGKAPTPRQRGEEKPDGPALTLWQAVSQALGECLQEDERVIVIGEDVTVSSEILHDPVWGPYFQVVSPIRELFGDKRVWEPPLAEGSWVLAAVAAASHGLRPIVDVMNVGFLASAFDALANQAALTPWVSAGRVRIPLVVRAIVGAGVRAGAQHSHMWHSIFCRLPGLKVVMPVTPDDAYHLLKAAVKDDDPVLFLEHIGLYGEKGPVGPEGPRALGKARVRRQGTEVTVVAAGKMVLHALDASREMPGRVEVIDPVTLSPLDWDTMVQSVDTTGRLIVIDESPWNLGWAQSVLGEIMQRIKTPLRAPPRVITAPDCPVPYSPALEDQYLPGRDRIEQAIRDTLRWS